MQLERKRHDLEKAGVGIAAISFDSTATLGHFAERMNISFAMLSDSESKIIREFGLLNTEVPEDHQFYGIPHPVEFLLAPDRTVQAKYHEESYRDRFTAGRVLVRELGSESGAARTSTRSAHLKVTAWASDGIVRGGNRLALVLDIDLNEKMHVYAPSVEGYIPIEWQMEEAEGLTHYDPEFPESKTLHLPAIDETVPVYEGSIRLVRDIMVGQGRALGDRVKDGKLTIRGSLRYQACDDRMCYLPTTLPVEWTFVFEEHDRTRVPEELRR